MYDYLMEPKLQKTIDGEFIELRTYLCGEKSVLIKLKSDVVLMIEESRNSIKFLLPDKNGCYDLVSDIYPTNPTRGHLEFNIDASFLTTIQKLYKTKVTDRDYFNSNLDSINLYMIESSMARD